MTRVQTNIKLPPGLFAALTQEAQAKGVSKQSLMVNILATALQWEAPPLAGDDLAGWEPAGETSAAVMRIIGGTEENPLRVMLDSEDAEYASTYRWHRYGRHLVRQRRVGGGKVKTEKLACLITGSDKVRWANGDIYDLRKCNLLVPEGARDAARRPTADPFDWGA